MTQHWPGLDVLCPMHIVLQPDGRIAHVGPTLRKIAPGFEWAGQGFLSVFDITRPQNVNTPEELFAVVGQTLHLRGRAVPTPNLKGVIVARPDGGQGLVVNLSFGISVIDAVQSLSLSGSDFAPTDLTVEMLYLVEAKSAVMAASRHLNARLQDAKSVAERQASTDALTGLTNRRGFESFVDKLIARQSLFAILHVDLDRFKQINDTLGHDAGDLVLQKAAGIMSDALRDRDLVARIGGDEFVMVVDGDPDRTVVDKIGARLIDQISSMALFEDEDMTVGCSIGAVFSDQVPQPTIHELLKAADLALYASKGRGRGRMTIFDPTSDLAAE